MFHPLQNSNYDKAAAGSSVADLVNSNYAESSVADLVKSNYEKAAAESSVADLANSERRLLTAVRTPMAPTAVCRVAATACGVPTVWRPPTMA